MKICILFKFLVLRSLRVYIEVLIYCVLEVIFFVKIVFCVLMIYSMLGFRYSRLKLIIVYFIGIIKGVVIYNKILDL